MENAEKSIDFKIMSKIQSEIEKDATGLAFMVFSIENYQAAILQKLEGYRREAFKEVLGN